MIKKIFITDYVGLSTRLEALATAFLISEKFGHQVCIDWLEADALTVDGTRKGNRGLLGRLNSIKLKEDWPDKFSSLANYTNINLRTHHGPEHLLGQRYLSTAKRVKLRSDLIEVIKDTFNVYRDRPLVGVHIRRGDFPLVNPDRFDVNASEWPAVPDWWYEHVMSEIQKCWPDVAFFVSCSGSLNDFPKLQAKFDMFDLPVASPYINIYHGHAAARHPATDLFALACCRTLIGSPCSTFTHYAANMLGESTQILVPPSQPMTESEAAFFSVKLFGKSAARWYAACREGHDAERVTELNTLDLGKGASLDWLQGRDASAAHAAR